MMNEKPTVLAVDDEQGALRSLEMILKGEYHVLVAQNGKQAVELLDQQPVDFVITDIHMPDMTGIQVLRHSKERDPSREVLIVTGYANMETAKSALRLGALDYIEKPYDPSEVIKNVQKGIEKKRKAQEAFQQLKTLNKEKESLEDLLMKSEKNDSLGELTFGVVHEINNPLTVIQGYVDLILKQLNQNGEVNFKDPKYQDYLKTVEGQIHQCRNIAMDFLSFVRGGNGEQKSLDLKLMLQDLIKMYRSSPLAREVEFSLVCDKQIPEIQLSIGLIRQVFVNLIVNALHAMNSRGKLQITLHRKESGVEIDFKDSGKGISKENREKIFETFFTTREGGKGSGLGLSISKKIVERHGGTISYESEVGHGTTFTIFLPFQPQAQHQPTRQVA